LTSPERGAIKSKRVGQGGVENCLKVLAQPREGIGLCIEIGAAEGEEKSRGEARGTRASWKEGGPKRARR